jgi:predicted PurR-regulated permease PerM
MSQARQIFVRPAQKSDETPRGPGLVLRVLVGALCLVAFLALAPFLVPLVLAAWAALAAKPLYRLLAKRIHRRKGAAALVTVLLVVAFLTPLLIATLSLSGAAIELGRRLLEAGSGKEALRSLAADGGNTAFDFHKLDLRQVVDLARRHGAGAMGVASTLLGAATVTILGVLVFVSAFYKLLFEGHNVHEWLLLHAPLPRGQFQRLSNAFAEVGRGLLIGVGLTALFQGAGVTLGYLACGVPQPLVLGLVTVVASLIPSIGSGLVWLPVTAGLAISGRPGAAAVMLAIGCLVSMVDNLLRPILARWGQLHMDGLLLFIAMLGGVAVFGAGGLLLGPLVVRLAIEGLAMLRETSPESFPV